MISKEKKKENIIDSITLNKLYSLEGKTVDSVYCYLWINQVQPEKSIEIIDAVEFNFTDGDTVTISCNESQEGLIITDYNFEKQKETIEKTFPGKLKIFKVSTEKTEMWKNIINTKLTKVKLNIDKEANKYLSDEFIFEFENKEMRLIQVHPLDGIILDYYEEI